MDSKVSLIEYFSAMEDKNFNNVYRVRYPGMSSFERRELHYEDAAKMRGEGYEVNFCGMIGNDTYPLSSQETINILLSGKSKEINKLKLWAL